VEKYTKRVIPGLIDDTRLEHVPLVKTAITKLANVALENSLDRMRGSDYVTGLVKGKDRAAGGRFSRYIASSMMEFSLIPGHNLVKERPDIFLFGHTHVPVTNSITYNGTGLLNSGGWLEPADSTVHAGGVVFKYEGGGFTPVTVQV